MTNNPLIPMSPNQLPQQRIHEVVVLPSRPEPFDCVVGYGQFPKGSLPHDIPSDPDYLCQVEWAWSPANNRIDAYYLHLGRTHWSLWSRYWDDNYGEWLDMAVGCVRRRDITRRQAATYLLLEFWKDEANENNLDEFHWINESVYLTVADVAAIAREVWS